MKSDKAIRSLLLTISGFAIVNCLPQFHSAVYAGIIGNIDKSSNYAKFGSSNNFPWVGELIPLNFDKATKKVTTPETELGSCTSTIIHSTKKYGIWALTAGHCVYDNGTGSGPIKSYNSGAMYFGSGNKIDYNKYLFQTDVIVKKEYVDSVNKYNVNKPGGFLGEVSTDIALIKLANPDPKKLLPDWLSTVTKPIPKVPEKPLPKKVSIGDFVGVGAQGSGASGIAGNSIYSENYLGGQNYVTTLDKFMLYDLDGINPKTNIDGKPALELEYSPTSGDSGSPVFINDVLAGVHSRSQGAKYVCGMELCQFNRGFYGTIGYALKTDQYNKWISDVITGYKPGDAVSLKGAKGGKFKLKPVDKSPKPLAEADSIEFEIPDNIGFYVFNPSEDIFRTDYSDEEFNKLYTEAVINNTPNSGDNPPPPEQVPEPITILSSLFAGALGIGLKQKYKQKRAIAPESNIS